MWGSVAGSLLMLVVMAPGAFAQATPAPPAFKESPAQQAALGVWTSDADPGGAITITADGVHGVSVTSNHGYEAVGYLLGREFVGLTRDPSLDKAPAGPFTYGILQIHFTKPGVATAEFSPALGARATRSETWRLTGRFGEQADTDTFSVPRSDGLPKFGEYVYVEELPEAIQRVPPDYPTWARERNISGTVMVQALVGKDGAVKQTIVVKSIPQLDDYAMAAVKQWRFKPAMAKGVPVAVWVAVPVKFTLH